MLQKRDVPEACMLLMWAETGGIEIEATKLSRDGEPAYRYRGWPRAVHQSPHALF